MSVTFMDSTLRDGANVVGHGFDEAITRMVLEGLTDCHIPYIEFGNCGGIGAYDSDSYTKALTDDQYLRIAVDFVGRGSALGMFVNARRFRAANAERARSAGLSFLRVGANAGDGSMALEPIRIISAMGMKVFYSLMKAYVLTADELAEEAKALEEAGADEITIMDSAGTMLPDQVAEYTEKLVKAVRVPVGFHGHNNLGLSVANSLTAYEHGASILDCCLMGMARSAGNTPTEACAAALLRRGRFPQDDWYHLLDFLDLRLIPAVQKLGYHPAIRPLDLVLGYSGCHSSFVGKMRTIAEEENVPLYRLIAEVSAREQRKPSEDLIRQTAQQIKT